MKLLHTTKNKNQKNAAFMYTAFPVSLIIAPGIGMTENTDIPLNGGKGEWGRKVVCLYLIVTTFNLNSSVSEAFGSISTKCTCTCM